MEDYVAFMKKVWSDEAFKKAYMKDPKKVLKQEGIKVDEKVELVVVENTPKKIYIRLEPKPANINEWAKQNAQVRASKWSVSFCSDRRPCCNWVFYYFCLAE